MIECNCSYLLVWKRIRNYVLVEKFLLVVLDIFIVHKFNEKIFENVGFISDFGGRCEFISNLRNIILLHRTSIKER